MSGVYSPAVTATSAGRRAGNRHICFQGDGKLDIKFVHRRRVDWISDHPAASDSGHFYPKNGLCFEKRAATPCEAVGENRLQPKKC